MTRRRWFLPLVLGALALLSGCNGGPCKAARTSIQAVDGGQVRCARAEDCPRTSNAAICTDSGEPNLPTQSCIRCEETVCWLYACSS